MVSRAAEQDDWRRKYFDSLRAAEHEERGYRVQLQLLYKLVGRLCLAAQGQSPRLDQELKRLRDAVRRELPAEQFEPMSQGIADAVLEMDNTGGATTTGGRAMPAREAEAAAVSVQPGPAADSELPGEAILGNERIRSVVLRLLSELRAEPQLVESADAIESGLAVSMSADQLPQLIEQVGGLVVRRISGLQRAQQEMEILLGQMMGQLDSLTRYIAGQSQDDVGRTSSSETLNVQITGEVRAIGASVDNGTDVMQIRRQLRERLNSISRHLQAFREREEERTRLSRERTELMRARMEEMEGEARKLHARLVDEKRLSLLDPLTQIPNRLAWEQRLAEEMERWKRFRHATCIAAWDIDQFKIINDNFGHRAGDKVLAVVAEALARSIRSTDFVARYGGEEFVMLLPGTSLADGVQLAEQMRQAVAGLGFHFRGNPVSVSISCGITLLRDGDEEHDAFDRADKAMYQAKDGGRNRVVSV